MLSALKEAAGPSREALSLRAWALRVLAGDPDAPAPEAGERAWRLFLETEGCAAPLRARLAAAGAEDRLAAPLRALLAARATDEAQRFLSARAHLRTLGRVAAERGTEMVVLKGGAAAAEGGEPLHLADLDLLLRDAEADAFAEAILPRGYAPVRADPEREDDDWHHLAQRVAPDAIQVEIHFRLRSFDDLAPLWSRARPVDALPGVLRMAPADHAWHLLLHAVVESPFRRGRIRDLLLVGRELARMDAGDAAEVERRSAAHPFAAPLAAFAAAARGLAAGSAADPHARVAAGNYLLRAALGGRGWPTGRAETVNRTLFTLLGGAADRRAYLDHLLHFSPRASRAPRVAALERRVPSLGRAVRLVHRVSLRARAAAAALPLALLARRLVRRM